MYTNITSQRKEPLLHTAVPGSHTCQQSSNTTYFPGMVSYVLVRCLNTTFLKLGEKTLTKATTCVFIATDLKPYNLLYLVFQVLLFKAVFHFRYSSQGLSLCHHLLVLIVNMNGYLAHTALISSRRVDSIDFYLGFGSSRS